MSSSQSPKSSSASSDKSSSQSQESVAIRFLNAVIDFMAKNPQSPSEIYQLLAQTGSVLLLQSEEFPKYMTRYIENKFEEADKEHSNNALNNFQAKYQIVVQLFNLATFLQNVRLPAILPFMSPVLTPEEQRKVEFKLEGAPLVKQYDFHHFQEISIATLECLLQSNRSPIQTADYREANHSNNKTKIPPHILNDVRFSLMAPKIEIQLASLYLQRLYHPFEVLKDMNHLSEQQQQQQQQFPPLYTHNHDKFYRSSNDDIALYYLKSALNVITPQNSPDDYAVAYSQMAHLLKQKKKYDEAIKAFQKVLEVRKVTDSDPTKYASLCMNIANTYLAKEEEAFTRFKEEYSSHKDDIVVKLFKEYSIILKESVLLHTSNLTTCQEQCEKFEQVSKEWLKSIDCAIEWFGKSEHGFKQLKKPPSHEKKELSTQDQYIGLVSINLGYAHLLKTKLYMQIISNYELLLKTKNTQKKNLSETIKKAKTSAENGIVVLKTALEVIKPDVHEKDSILQKVRHMGSESFPKLNLYLAECYMSLYVCDRWCCLENSEAMKEGNENLHTYLEEARTCLDLGSSLFMKKEMKDWRVRLNVLLFEVYFKSSHGSETPKEKKEQFLERSMTALKEAVKDKVQQDDDVVTYDVDNFLNKYLESLSLSD
ncbi:hypothetical protein C9374_009780 [Naegleria lovaniensis]|uniref:Uncharacterized protein n=1 Tax=Naegleria lovaniensis TaxID=51637 RepID=A0AA88KPJ3_NAELO|nr:uncharacterized protein C9374_009780 [Naegleria lovaniensis]KAG2393203.1 hypothetical protein C9374_009780 [Naegleria lovaniensis]